MAFADLHEKTAHATVSEFELQPLVEADLPQLCPWLNRPHLHKWWREGEPVNKSATCKASQNRARYTIAARITRRFFSCR